MEHVATPSPDHQGHPLQVEVRAAAIEHVATPLPVGELMTREVIAVAPATPVPEVARLLHTRRITGVPVVDGEQHVLGIVSELDVLSRPGATARDIMSRQVISVTAETDAAEVARLFASRRIRRVPVLADGRLVGIVSRADLIRPSVVPHIRPGDQNDLCMETDQA